VLGWEAGEGEEIERSDLTPIKHMYDGSWRYFETGDQQIEYPGYPIQGRWKVDAIGLQDDVLAKLYYQNARRLIPGL
jgi:hypothetical protein